MSKRISHLERAILDLEDQIAAYELARNALIRLRPTAPKAKPTPRRVLARAAGAALETIHGTTDAETAALRRLAKAYPPEAS